MIKAQDLVLPSVAALAPYEPGKPIEELQRELGVVEPVKLASNENPLGPSPRAIEAIKAALPELNRYPDGASYELRAKIAAHHGIAVERVFAASGSVEVLNLLAFLYLRPGLNAVYSEHSFAIYPLATAAAGGAHRVVKTLDGFSHDLEAMASACDENTRIVFLGNPNNPTGTIYRRAEWKHFLERVPENVVIVADEAYFEFVRDPNYPDSLEDHDGRRLLITLRTFSKIFGLAGIRVGYAVARPDMIQMLHNVRQPFNVTSIGQVAAIAGMGDRAHIARTLQVNAEGMAYLEGEFARLKLPFVPSHANFFLVDVGDGRAVYDQLLRKGVIVTAVIRPEKFDSAAMSALSWFRCTCVYLMGGVFVVIVSDTLYGANFNMNHIVFCLLALAMLTGANLIQQLRRLRSAGSAPSGGGIRI